VAEADEDRERHKKKEKAQHERALRVGLEQEVDGHGIVWVTPGSCRRT
jgi:hypothetical protein